MSGLLRGGRGLIVRSCMMQEVEVTTYDKRKIKALTLETSRGARHPSETPLTYPSKR